MIYYFQYHEEVPEYDDWDTFNIVINLKSDEPDATDKFIMFNKATGDKKIITLGRVLRRQLLKKWEGKYPEDLMQSALKVIFEVGL